MNRNEFEKSEPYGIKYGFFLDDDLVGNKFENDEVIKIDYVPEYLVVLPEFIKLAKEYGLEVVDEFT